MVCEFQSLTGLRYGELAALQTQDYDKEKQEIDVNGTLSCIGSFKDSAMRLSPKSSYSIRKVSLDARVNEIINYFLTVNKARRLWKSNFHKNDYIFITEGGLPFDLHYINKVIKKVGFFKPITTHTFRHTHISLFSRSKCPSKGYYGAYRA